MIALNGMSSQIPIISHNSFRTLLGEVQSDHNFEFFLQYLASFAHDLPRKKELEVRLVEPVSAKSYMYLSFKSWFMI